MVFVAKNKNEDRKDLEASNIQTPIVIVNQRAGMGLR